MVSLGAVIVAAVFWTNAEVEFRPKYKDEQTLIAGAIWSQIVILLGLIISSEVDDHLHPFVHGYFLLAGSVLLIATGVSLIITEYKKMHTFRQSAVNESGAAEATSSRAYDRAYLTIGALCVLAGTLTFIDFIIIITPALLL
ncbi:unnamed protein product [Parnassius apollo]|uniref:(apollo) hypothetical protein n=1 Tax=Parnassius apollo TaxID=110799 RepID=A0A8S3WPH6_PARAO|nr:unnamed protein product [Parnassius apollo]